MTQIHDGVITHLEPDILECKVKWALELILLRQSQAMRVNGNETNTT